MPKVTKLKNMLNMNGPFPVFVFFAIYTTKTFFREFPASIESPFCVLQRLLFELLVVVVLVLKAVLIVVGKVVPILVCVAVLVLNVVVVVVLVLKVVVY